MKLTPIDIRKWEFKKGVRGYDKYEVQAFLELASEEFEKLQQERREFEQKSKRLEKEIEEYRRVEKSLQDTLISAKETTDKSMQNSRKEAELIVGDAELHADKIMDSARKKASKIEDEITRLTVLRDSFAVKLKGMLNSQIELLELFEDVNKDEDENKVKEESIAVDKSDPEPVKVEPVKENAHESDSEEKSPPASMMDDFLKEKSESNGPL
ncbi:MAG: DivIVA domain-containing protein [Candidatus Marinimicrobia bacterium]|nr:DivIVA domain-containing protein [Candidatus Neomarinimicrobiota bacterium]MCH8305575.1 DivIVA domain-containing protein [Candidatus Neomarinimicrobiota bacterium]TFB09716.1 DivIVA domain-containing protein [Candidatus Marinimicrobia bacterium MT.SAG.2]